MERNTAQRDAIRSAIEAAGRPLSPQEILESAQSRVPKLGMATVYRTIKGLVEEGWLTPVELPGQPARFELSHIAHHHHFHCRTCGRVFDIQGCPGPLTQVSTPAGFEVDEHEVVLYGRCPSCAAARSKARR